LAAAGAFEVETFVVPRVYLLKSIVHVCH
jgi:hypothetical protein